jgi:hypothetical protein
VVDSTLSSVTPPPQRAAANSDDRRGKRSFSAWRSKSTTSGEPCGRAKQRLLLWWYVCRYGAAGGAAEYRAGRRGVAAAAISAVRVALSAARSAPAARRCHRRRVSRHYRYPSSLSSSWSVLISVFRVAIGKYGENCYEACKRNELRCNVDYFHMINNCDSVRRVFGDDCELIVVCVDCCGTCADNRFTYSARLWRGRRL